MTWWMMLRLQNDDVDIDTITITMWVALIDTNNAFGEVHIRSSIINVLSIRYRYVKPIILFTSCLCMDVREREEVEEVAF